MIKNAITVKFVQDLRNADSEKLVESAYHNALRHYFPFDDIKTACKTDGVLETRVDFDGNLHVLKLIIETKYEENFSLPIIRAKVLAQVVYYLKRFDDMGDAIPNIVLVGDKDECFVVHSNNLLQYLDLDYNWKMAPSSAGTKNMDLVERIVENTELQEECFVFAIDDNFSFEDVYNRIYDLAVNRKTQVRITEKSISKVFDYFSMRVLKKNTDGTSKYTPREQVELFMILVNSTDDCFSHPNKRNSAIFGDRKNIAIDTPTFEAFKRYYSFKFNAKEKKDFTAIADRLIEDSDRRRKGDFYTPSIWVDEAHKMLAENLGTDWKDEYMVWDCAWGTGNLTRDYKFWDLYCSTLEEHDLVIGKKYNEGACKFQYDFLNDDVELFDDLLSKVKEGYKLSEKDFKGSKLYKSAPNLIKGLVVGKKLLFLINPPYGTANTFGHLGQDNYKSSIALTKINEKMKANEIGASSQQLYAQFLYRIALLNDLFDKQFNMGIFSPSLYMSGQSFEKLREYLDSSLTRVDGMLFQASEFADVSATWGISFVVWKSEKGVTSPIKINKPIKVNKVHETGVLTLENKLVYAVSKDKNCSTWCKTDSKEKAIDAPQMTSAIKYSNTPSRGKLVKDALGYYFNVSNIVEKNTCEVFLLSSCSKSANGISILEDNVLRVLSSFTARKLITGQYATWMNGKDEYMIPNTGHELYKQWENDCLVYSLFNTSSNQSSLRGISYNNKRWDVLNHFFFMSKQDMLDLALGENPNDDVYEDIQNFADDERFIYKKLQEVTLSEDAQAVLNKAMEIVVNTFKYRKYFNETNPEYHINTWDASWYQIKGLCKEYAPDDLKEFIKLYKAFEDRMRPLVYELGFLYK